MASNESVAAVASAAATLQRRLLATPHLTHLLSGDSRAALEELIDAVTAADQSATVEEPKTATEQARGEEEVVAAPRATAIRETLGHSRTIRGMIEGAEFSIHVPKATWNRRVLIFAHGHRCEGTGTSTVDLDPQHPFYQHSLLERGWLVAATSYRRDGVIIRDAMEDIDNLRAEVVRRFGEPDCVILEGRSMGGAICTLLAERERKRDLERASIVAWPDEDNSDNADDLEMMASSENGIGDAADPHDTTLASQSASTSKVPSSCAPVRLYHGVLAVGAALNVDRRFEESAPEFTYRPGIPCMFVSNVGEAGPVQAYATAAREQAMLEQRQGEESIVVPAIWQALREGHGNLSVDERAEALSSLLAWLNHGTCITINSKQVLAPPRLRAEGWARVTKIDVHGSFSIDMQNPDLKRLGIQQGQDFVLEVPGRQRVSEHSEARKVLCHYSFGAFHHTHAGPRYMAYENAGDDALTIATYSGGSAGAGDGDNSSGEEGGEATATEPSVSVGGLRVFKPAAVELGLSVHDHVRISSAPPKRAQKLARGRLQLRFPAVCSSNKNAGAIVGGSG